MKNVANDNNKKPIGDLIIKLKERIRKDDEKQQEGLNEIAVLAKQISRELTPSTFTFAYPYINSYSEVN